MTRFYFDFRDGSEPSHDDEGMEFEQVDDALREARRAVAGIVKDYADAGVARAVEVHIRDNRDGPVIAGLVWQPDTVL